MELPIYAVQIFYLSALERQMSFIRGVWLVLLLSCFVEMSELNANSVDPDQTPRSAALWLLAAGLFHVLSCLLSPRFFEEKAGIL